MPEFRPKVDYSLRPAKSVVRRMVLEAIAQLEPLGAPRSYRYVGMGSIYFLEFQLVHRLLGIEDMITIEGMITGEERIRFNLPLACIRVMMGSTGEALPDIHLEEKPHILWLDYESRVTRSVLADIDQAVGRCAPGSILLFTVNAERFKSPELDEWFSELGVDGPPPTLPQRRVDHAAIPYGVLRARLERAIRERNAGVPERQRIHFRQAFHMVHADGARMLTIGGALVAEADLSLWDTTGIESLAFARSGADRLEIKFPLLTRREMIHLLQEMPMAKGNMREAARAAGIPSDDAREFAAVYRFAPLFVEAGDF